MDLTPQEKLLERIKCVKDPIYFLNTYGYVFNAVENKVTPMKCFDYQVKCVKDFHKYRNNIVLKSRQTGLSVITAGYVAWRLMFRYEEKILIIANKGDGAIRFLDTVKQFIERTPEWLKPAPIAKNNQTELEFAKPHASWVKAFSKSRFLISYAFVKSSIRPLSFRSVGRNVSSKSPQFVKALMLKSWSSKS